MVAATALRFNGCSKRARCCRNRRGFSREASARSVRRALARQEGIATGAKA